MMNGLDHHILCPMQYCTNAPVSSETTHAIQLILNRATSYFKVRMPTWEEYENQNILKIELMAEAPPWNL